MCKNLIRMASILLTILLIFLILGACQKTQSDGTLTPGSGTKTATAIKTTAKTTVSQGTESATNKTTADAASATASTGTAEAGNTEEAENEPAQSDMSLITEEDEPLDISETPWVERMGAGVIDREYGSKIDFDGKTVTVFYWVSSANPTLGKTEAGDVIYRTWERCQEKYNCKLEWILYPYASYAKQITNNILAGIYFADTAMIENIYAYPTLIKNNFFKPIGKYIDEKEGWWSTQIKWKGEIYGLTPDYPKPLACVTIYNSEMLQREGLPDIIDLSKSNHWTWDECLDIAIKTTKDLNGDGILDQWGIFGDGPGMRTLFFTDGARMLVQTGDTYKTGLFEPKAIKSFQFMQSLYNTYKVVSLTNNINRFRGGFITMQFDLTGRANEHKTAGMTSFKVAPVPMGPDVKVPTVGYIDSGSYYFLSISPYETKDLVAFMTDSLSDWDTLKPEYNDLEKAAIETYAFKTANSYENAQYMWEFRLSSDLQYDFVKGFNSYYTLFNNVLTQIRQGTAISVGTLLEQNRGLFDDAINSYIE